MIPIEIEDDVRKLELMLGEGSAFHSGACAKDMQQPYRGDCVVATPKRSEELEMVLETYHVSADRKVAITRGREMPPLSFYLRKGEHCDFQI